MERTSLRLTQAQLADLAEVRSPLLHGADFVEAQSTRRRIDARSGLRSFMERTSLRHDLEAQPGCVGSGLRSFMERTSLRPSSCGSTMCEIESPLLHGADFVEANEWFFMTEHGGCLRSFMERTSLRLKTVADDKSI